MEDIFEPKMKVNNTFGVELWCEVVQNLKRVHAIPVTPPKQKILADVLYHHMKSIKATNYFSFYFTANLSKAAFQQFWEKK